MTLVEERTPNLMRRYFPAAQQKPTLRQILVNRAEVAIGPEIAREIRQKMTHHFQFTSGRGVAAWQVTTLSKMMKAEGQWTSGKQLMFARYPDGHLELINGHHRMDAIVEAGVTLPFTIHVIDVANAAESAAIYAREDRGVRGKRDNTVIQSSGLLESYGLQKVVASSLFRGVKFLEQGFQNGRNNTSTDGERVAACYEFGSLAKEFQDSVQNAPRGIQTAIRSATILTCGLITFDWQEPLAKVFWKGVAEGECSMYDPRQLLHREMLKGLNSHPASVARAVESAWNAHFNKRSSRQIIVRLDRPLKFAGCQWSDPNDAGK